MSTIENAMERKVRIKIRETISTRDLYEQCTNGKKYILVVFDWLDNITEVIYGKNKAELREKLWSNSLDESYIFAIEELL